MIVVYVLQINFGIANHFEGFAISINAIIVPRVIPIKIAKYDTCIVNKKPCNNDSIYFGVLNNSPILSKKLFI